MRLQFRFHENTIQGRGIPILDPRAFLLIKQLVQSVLGVWGLLRSYITTGHRKSSELGPILLVQSKLFYDITVLRISKKTIYSLNMMFNIVIEASGMKTVVVWSSNIYWFYKLTWNTLEMNCLILMKFWITYRCYHLNDYFKFIKSASLVYTGCFYLTSLNCKLNFVM